MNKKDEIERFTMGVIIMILLTLFLIILVQSGCTLRGYKFSISKITIAEDKIDVEVSAQDEAQEDCAAKDRLKKAYPDDIIYDGDDIYIITDEGKVKLIDSGKAVYRKIEDK
jgi:hypothetical protein